MRIKELRLKNFRSYKDEVIVEFNDLTAFVGKNDIGKSTILEALDVFFNDGKNNNKGVRLLPSTINTENLMVDGRSLTPISQMEL